MIYCIHSGFVFQLSKMSSNEQNGAFPYVSDQPGPWLLPFQYSNNFEQKVRVISTARVYAKNLQHFYSYD